MKNISVETINPYHEKISISVERKNIISEFEKSIKKQAKEAQIPGFRKGMVPPGLIKKSKGNIIYTQQLFQEVEKQLSDYLKEEDYQILGQPLMTDVPDDINYLKGNDKYTFHFEVGKKPDVNPINITQEQIDEPIIIPAAEMVEEEVKIQQRKYGTFQDINEVQSEEDVLHLSFLTWDPDAKKTVGNETTDVLLVKYFHKETAKQLVGKKVEDQLVVQLKKAFEDKELSWILKDLKIHEEQDAKEKYYQITITKIAHIEPLSISEKLFSQAYPDASIKTEEDFRGKIKEDIDVSWKQQAERYMQNQVYNIWIEKTKITLPEKFLKKWYAQNEGKGKSEEEIATQFETFITQLKWTLTSQSIATTNKLEVDKDDIMNAIQEEITSYYGANISDEQKHKAMTQVLSNTEYIQNIQQKLLNQKILTWGVSKAKRKTHNISSKAFIEKIESEQKQLPQTQ